MEKFISAITEAEGQLFLIRKGMQQQIGTANSKAMNTSVVDESKNGGQTNKAKVRGDHEQDSNAHSALNLGESDDEHRDLAVLATAPYSTAEQQTGSDHHAPTDNAEQMATLNEGERLMSPN